MSLPIARIPKKNTNIQEKQIFPDNFLRKIRESLLATSEINS